MQNKTIGILMENISKDFSGKYAVSDVTLSIKHGTIHSIVGENGAGKSTLMGILNGIMYPTVGQIFIDGTKLKLGNPKESSAAGLGMVYQHFMLVPTLTVWQNIILGEEPLQRFRKIDEKEAIRRIKQTCDTYGFSVNVHQRVGDLTVGQQQEIEILKILYKDAKYIVLDEPTAVLTPREIETLFSSIRALKEKGKTIIFISHKLGEVMEISDEITVIKDGKLINTVDAKSTQTDDLVHMMVGRKVNMGETPISTKKGKVILSVNDINLPKYDFTCGLKNINFEIREGEILGVAGVEGNGQTELIEALLCLQKPKSGNIIKDGEDVTKLKNSKLRDKGVACIPPDRHRQGLVLDSSIKQNIVLGCEELPSICNGPLISKTKLATLTEELCKEYGVKMASVNQPIRDLSGGNQQKIILARECGVRDTNLIFAVNPTRGLDVGAIEFVYSKLEQYKKEGKAILLISTELNEIMRLSDRIAVMFNGEIMDILEGNQATIKNIGSLMAGIKNNGTRDGRGMIL